MKLFLAILLVLTLNSSVACPVSANTLFPGADPAVIEDSQKYWIFPTAADGTTDECLYAYESRDLLQWSKSRPILCLSDIKWLNDDGEKNHGLWAPGIFHEGDVWYLYYSVGPQGKTPSRIGVALGQSPNGRFIDSGRPLITGGDGFEAIDAMVFRDPQSKRVFLYCGGSAGSTLHVYELNADLVSIKSQLPVDNPVNFTEGAFMHYFNGRYYLSYSHGRWSDDSYGVCYSTADSPTGPWTYRGKILQGDKTSIGPGHHSFFFNAVDQNWYIVYHRWERLAGGKRGSTRMVSIDHLFHARLGLLKPVVMTESGVGAVPIPTPASVDPAGRRHRSGPTLPDGVPIPDSE
ncbi:MAG: family 43 glycosylhydrolase [Cyanobacteria bacterium SZAS LIN-3]|nr:family 43 glycosylhydrolase [Cyanobacteria bacterium SZAS LIN-3]